MMSNVPLYPTLTAIAVLVSGVISGSAHAAPALPAYGPPPPGICLFARDAALSASQVGMATNLRLEQLRTQVQAEINAERDAIAAEDKALTAERPRLSDAQFQLRATNLQQRAQKFDSTVKARNDQLGQTQATAVGQIIAALNPLLATSIAAHGCGVVFERKGTYGFNPATDLTPDLVKRLNVAMPTLVVNLAPLR